MAYQEMYFVQLFGLTAKNRLSLVATYHANNAEHAAARAQAYFDRGVAGAIAFSQLVDETAEDAQEPTLLAAFGRVPALYRLTFFLSGCNQWCLSRRRKPKLIPADAELVG